MASNTSGSNAPVNSDFLWGIHDGAASRVIKVNDGKGSDFMCLTDLDLSPGGEVQSAECDDAIVDKRLSNCEQIITTTAFVKKGFTIPARFAFISVTWPEADTEYTSNYSGASAAHQWRVTEWNYQRRTGQYVVYTMTLTRSPSDQP